MIREDGTPLTGATVHAFSDAEEGCESLDLEFGVAVTEADGVFRLGLATGIVQEGVCVLVFAQHPEGAALGVSDTVLLVMDFRDEPTVNSAEVQLVLGAE